MNIAANQKDWDIMYKNFMGIIIKRKRKIVQCSLLPMITISH